MYMVFICHRGHEIQVFLNLVIVGTRCLNDKSIHLCFLTLMLFSCAILGQVHHGGAGTVAAGLKAAVIILVMRHLWSFSYRCGYILALFSVLPLQ